MRYFLAVVFALMLSAGGAFAHHSPGHGVPPGQGGGEGGGGIGGGGGGGAGGDGGAGGHAHQGQGQAQGQLQGQLQGQGQAQGQIGINKNYNDNSNSNKNYNSDFNANVNVNKAEADARASAYAKQQQSQGNTQKVIFEDSGRADVNYSGKYKVENVPGIAIGGPASGPCNGFSGGIGASWLGGSIGANTSVVDDGCEDRETARMFHLLGDTASGLELLKTSKAYTRMLERKADMKKKADAETAEKAAQAEKDIIRAKNPTSDGSWKGAYTSDAKQVQPTRIWSGNSDGQSMAFTSFPASSQNRD
jgi:hypothetical protein